MFDNRALFIDSHGFRQPLKQQWSDHHLAAILFDFDDPGDFIELVLLLLYQLD